MIEKLKEHDVVDPKTDKVIGTMACDLREIMDKLNEVIDVTNRHEDIIKQIGEWGSSKGECLWCETLIKVNLDDPYAEQRKWIGKVCKFWDNLDNNYSLALLVKIIEKEPMPFEDYRGNQWHHCEPVKPDDDIIYRGE